MIRVLVSVISSPENGGRRELVRRRHGEMCTGKSDRYKERYQKYVSVNIFLLLAFAG